MKNNGNKVDIFLKLAVIFGILIMSLSIAYYFIIFMPQLNNKKNEIQYNQKIETQKQEFENKQKCMEEGKKWYENNQIRHERIVNTMVISELAPECIYTNKLNTCLCLSSSYTKVKREDGSILDGGLSLDSITDIFSNSIIARFSRSVDKDYKITEILYGSLEELEKAKVEYGFK